MQEIHAELRKGPWLEEEDEQLASAVAVMGERRWDALAKASGLRRSGKSCRLRWMNYLRPNLKHGNISAEEERVIIHLHEKWGNKWSKIARKLPGRTDNEIKNYWRSYLKKKALVADKECSNSNINTSSDTTSLRSECGTTRSPCSINDDCFSIPSPESSNPFELLSLTRSPYETRLTEWMSSWSNDVDKTTSKDEFLNCDLYCIPQWNPDEYCGSAWDFPLWEGEWSFQNVV